MQLHLFVKTLTPGSLQFHHHHNHHNFCHHQRHPHHQTKVSRGLDTYRQDFLPHRRRHAYHCLLSIQSNQAGSPQTTIQIPPHPQKPPSAPLDHCPQNRSSECHKEDEEGWRRSCSIWSKTKYGLLPKIGTALCRLYSRCPKPGFFGPNRHLLGPWQLNGLVWTCPQDSFFSFYIDFWFFAYLQYIFDSPDKKGFLPLIFLILLCKQQSSSPNKQTICNFNFFEMS